MRKEKDIENEIYNYLLSIGAVAEKIQSGSVMVKKPGYNHRMTLQSAGCPDIMCLYKGCFIGIEVKKNEKEVDKWVNIRNRYNGEGKTLDGLKSYDREIDQIKYAERIIHNKGQFLVTCNVGEVERLISIIDRIDAETH